MDWNHPYHKRKCSKSSATYHESRGYGTGYVHVSCGRGTERATYALRCTRHGSVDKVVYNVEGKKKYLPFDRTKAQAAARLSNRCPG